MTQSYSTLHSQVKSTKKDFLSNPTIPSSLRVIRSFNNQINEREANRWWIKNFQRDSLILSVRLDCDEGILPEDKERFHPDNG